MPETSDYKIVLYAISISSLVSIVGVIVLAVVDRQIPGELSSVAIASIASLGSILSPSPIGPTRR